MSYQRFAGWLAILAGVVGLFYSLAFVAESEALAALFLMLGGLFSSAVLIALYRRVRETDADFALWALVLVLVASFGSAIHGGYDLANVINKPEITDVEDTAIPPELAGDLADLPNLSNQPFPVDPRGLLTFGFAGLGLGVLSWLASRTPGFSRTLSYVGYLLAALLIVIYLGRLIALDASNPVLLVPALIAGLVVNPLWYIWLGLSLLRWPSAELGYAARQPMS